MTRSLPPELLAISPGNLGASGGAALLLTLERAAARGLSGVLLREPTCKDGPLLEFARTLRERLPRPFWLGLHDRPHLARACAADGVHVGMHSLTPAQARAQVPDTCALGYSAHIDDVHAAEADYVFLSPIFAPQSKPSARPALGWERAAEGLGRTGAAAWALGGLTAENLSGARPAGFRGVAAIGAFFAAGDVAQNVAKLRAAWEQGDE